MYGLILEGIGEAVRKKFGDETWEVVRVKAGIPNSNFVIHKTYSETVVPRLIKSTAEVTGRPQDELTEVFGVAFVNYVGKYGYDRIMRVLGRNLRDFINGLDNLHEYLRFSYQKMKPPSFFCENEARHGLTLHYRSKRRGFLYYVMGQITQVAKVFYNTPLEIELLSEEETLDMTHVVLKLHFDNVGYKDPDEVDAAKEKVEDELRIRSEMFFDVFPFHVVFNKGMVIKSIGTGLEAIMPYILDNCVDEMFSLVRPMVEFTMDNVIMHANNVFEILSVDPVKKTTSGSTHSHDEEDDDDPDNKMRRLRMKGQMIYMDEWDAIMFLGTPVMENLDKMFETGLFINDLSMHDSSRDLVLAGTQQQAELKMALDQEKQKSKKLEEVNKKLDQETKRSEALLYQMIPRHFAEKFKQGEKAATTCKLYDSVSVLYCTVDGIKQLCNTTPPDKVMAMLNKLYMKFDKSSDNNKVYKVETVGDAYMCVAGAPVETKYHALYLADMAVDMLTGSADVKHPASGDPMKIRVGVHMGPATAGVVGHRVPRFCFFGDTITTAQLLEAQTTGGCVHISENIRSEIAEYAYDIQKAGTVDPGTGPIETFWLTAKTIDGSSAKSAGDTTRMDGMVPGYLMTDDEIDMTHLYKPAGMDG